MVDLAINEYDIIYLVIQVHICLGGIYGKRHEAGKENSFKG